MQGNDVHSSVIETSKKNVNTHRGVRHTGLLLTILAILIMGFVAFVAANADVLSRHFGLTNINSSSSNSCSSSEYGTGCVSETKQRLEDEKRWKFLLDASVITTALSGAIIAVALLLLVRQISKLTGAINSSSTKNIKNDS